MALGGRCTYNRGKASINTDNLQCLCYILLHYTDWQNILWPASSKSTRRTCPNSNPRDTNKPAYELDVQNVRLTEECLLPNVLRIEKEIGWWHLLGGRAAAISMSCKFAMLLETHMKEHEWLSAMFLQPNHYFLVVHELVPVKPRQCDAADMLRAWVYKGSCMDRPGHFWRIDVAFLTSSTT